ncbi:MAG: SpoIVB peptidase [Oscillospiraceae bacterium]|nr:SpoIVB peptidase [Oscillospiraceae bacterium]
MKTLARIVRTSVAVLLILCGLIWGMICAVSSNLCEKYYVTQGASLEFRDYIKEVPESLPSISTGRTQSKTELKLFGVFPIKTVVVSAAESKRVVPGGIPFGIKMLSDGVMVTSLGTVCNSGALLTPAKDAGICACDVIVSINGKEMSQSSDVVAAVSKSGGKALEVVVRKEDGGIKRVKLSPVLDTSDNTYKVGIYLRDSSAGIGTVTYYDPETEVFGGLGHGVCDSETGKLISLLKGNVVGAEIDSVTKSRDGFPGQLNGHFATLYNTGSILKNDQTGVYGSLKNVRVVGDPLPVALKQEVKTGRATILTTLSGIAPEEFEIEIEKISYNSSRAVKNMVIRVTDKRLLKEAGGIVQGMSGSPIIQNGKLVGAVTHVFVNDCTRGYGIFAENMLESSQSVGDGASTSRLKDAS